MRQSVAVTILALAVSCGDLGPAPRPLNEIILDFCASEAPNFLAVRNEGGSWTRVTAGGGNTFTFQATDRVAVAMTFSLPSTTLTDIYYTTAEELAPLSGQACLESVGNKTVSGSVTGVPVGDRAVISLNGGLATVRPPQSNFTLGNLADGPRDLVAHRANDVGSDFVPSWLILRRALNPVSGATLPALAFGSEGLAPVTNTVSISGLSGSDDNYFDILFTTALGTRHLLYASPFFTSGSRTLYGVPGSLTQSGDLHQIALNADVPGGSSYRSLRHWYRTPSSKTLALASVLTPPTVSIPNSTPYLRPRAELSVQSDYRSFATAYFEQSDRSMYVTVTAAHFDVPPLTWLLEVPDLSGVAGFPANAGLRSGEGIDWFVEAYDGALAHALGAPPADGATLRLAGRGGTTAASQMAGASRASSSLRLGGAPQNTAKRPSQR